MPLVHTRSHSQQDFCTKIIISPCKLGMASTGQKQYTLAMFLILAFGISQVMSRKLNEASLIERHEQWMEKYGRDYKDAEEKQKRFLIFKDNVEFIESFNAAGDKAYKLGVNHLADLTIEELKGSRNGFKRSHELWHTTTSFKYESVTNIPVTIDWRNKGAVTPVKDQGFCGKIRNSIKVHNYELILVKIYF